MSYKRTEYQDHTNLDISRLIAAYSDLVMKWVNQGWKPYLVTFMFRQLCPMSRMAEMTNELERVYSSLVKRVTRRPHRKHQSHLRPILNAVPYFPRRGRLQHVTDLSTNDGIHAHGILLMPPRSRIKEDLMQHFAKNQHIYIRDRLLRLDIKPIETNIPHVVKYVFKSLAYRKLTFDDVIIFPKETGVPFDEVICQ